MTPANDRARRVLLVEDEPSIRRAISKFLTAEGLIMDNAVNGLAGHNMIARGIVEYDCILVDIRTPMMSGLELWDALQRERPDSCPRILFITGDVLNEPLWDALHATCRPCLLKPFTREELLAHVYAVLGSDSRSSPARYA